MGIETILNFSFLLLFFSMIEFSFFFFLFVKLDDEMLMNHQLTLQEGSLGLLWK